MNTLSQFSDWLYATQNKAFEQKRDSIPTVYTQFLAKGDSSQGDYRSVDSIGLGAAVYTPLGGTYYQDQYAPGTTRVTTYNTFTISVDVPWQLEEDMFNNNRVKMDKVKLFKNIAKDMADGQAWTREVIAADFLLKANSTTATRTWPGTFRDGLALGSTAHTLGGSGSTFTNLPTASALSYLTLQEAIKLLSDIPSERGRPQATVNGVTLVCGNYYMFRIAEILKSQLQPDTANNNVNVFKVSGVPGVSKVVFNQYLGNTSKTWAVIRDGQESLFYFDKNKPTYTKDRDPRTNVMIHKSHQRFAIDADSAKDIVINMGA